MARKDAASGSAAAPSKSSLPAKSDAGSSNSASTASTASFASTHARMQADALKRREAANEAAPPDAPLTSRDRARLVYWSCIRDAKGASDGAVQ